MKKILVSILVLIATINFIGCGESNNRDVNEQEKINTTKVIGDFSKEEAKYVNILNSGKTYEEMNGHERTEFSMVADNIDSFTEEFRVKYKDIIEKIDLTRKEAVAKWKEEDKIKKDEPKNEILKRENIIGTSNKNFKNIEMSKPTPVRNDKTGNWKISKVTTNEDILEYAKSYYYNNFDTDKEMHVIINFTLNTTTKISKLFDNVITVTTHEYVDNEEHDANKLFSGMVLGEYWIYLDNGDVEKIV